jgi:hypothetical protein
MKILRDFLLTNTAHASVVMLQAPVSAFDNIAGGRVNAPTFNFQSTAGNQNSGVGPDAMFGSGQAVIGGEGNIFLSAGTGLQPTATGSEAVLAVCTLPSLSFDQPGRGITVNALGSLTASGTGTAQRVRLWFNTGSAATAGTLLGTGSAGATIIADTGAVSNSVGAWSIGALVFKYGANGSNTQLGVHQLCQVGGTAQALLSPSLLTATESGPINVALTCIGSGVVGNVIANFMEVTASN